MGLELGILMNNFSFIKAVEYLLRSVLLHVFVCGACTCVQVCTRLCIYGKGQRRMTGVLLDHSPQYFLETGSLMETSGGHQGPSMCLLKAPPPPPSTGITDIHGHVQLFMRALKIQAKVHILV